MFLAAVILAGGTAARVGGADKASIEYAGRTFLEHALGAVAAAGEVAVVGEQVPTSRPATFVREDPPFGGPVAGLRAGGRALAGHPELLLVLAVAMPLVTDRTAARLLYAAIGRDWAVLVDDVGRRQLALAVRTERLDAVLPADPHGYSVRDLLAPLDLADVPALGDEARGVDPGRTSASWTDEPPGLPAGSGVGNVGPVNLHDWIDELCDVLDIETEVDEALVFDLARSAARNVTKVAAPITTYLLGVAAGAQDANPEQIERLAAKAQLLADHWDRPADAPDPDDVDDEVPDDSGVDHTGERFEDE